MNVSILSMQCNEGILLELWGHYHGRMIGYENINLFDNGSRDSYTLRVLGELQNRGVHVIREYAQADDYRRREEIIVKRMCELDQTLGRHSFHFPLDTDEFLGVADGHQFHFDRESIYKSLEPYLNSSGPLRVDSCRILNANPIRRDMYMRATGLPKTFFRRDSAKHLNPGFHDGTTVQGGPPLSTPITYIHLHFMTYWEHQYRALGKMRGRVSTFSGESIAQYKGLGGHLIPFLKGTRAQYYRRFLEGSVVEIPEFRRTLQEMNLEKQFTSLMEFSYISEPEDESDDLTLRPGYLAKKPTSPRLIKAMYGTGDCQKDVTPEVKKIIESGDAQLKASNISFGDPCPGREKRLRLTFEIEEGEAISLSDHVLGR